MASLPSLNTLRVFAIAARLGSFQAAAAVLGVTPGAVSRQIQTLESSLTGPLFRRLPRRVELTADGQALLQRIEPALADIDAAVRHLLRPVDANRVTVEAMPTFTMHWLLPRLPDFRARHPDITVTLHTRQGPIDRSQPADLYIRRDPAQFSGLTGTPFLQEQARLVASPGFLATHPTPDAAAVMALPRLSMRSRPDLWPLWQSRQEDPAPHIGGAHPPLDLDSTILALQAAGAGLGIALIPTFFLTDALNSGAVGPVPGFPPFDSGTYFWLAGGSPLSPASRIFLRWLTRIASHTSSHSVTS